MYKNLGTHWASSIPAFLALACVPFPFLFYHYGEPIRLKCKYAAKAAATLAEIRGDDPNGEKEERVFGEESDLVNDTDVETGESTEIDQETAVDMELKTELSKGH
jgi:hypothetical protein